MKQQRSRRLLAGSGNFVAIDFETADYEPDSACAIGLVRAERWQVVQRSYALIRPPRRYIHFSYLHGITWNHVKDQAAFAEAWLQLRPMLAGAEFLIAHNAGFDRRVLHACCRAAQLLPPDIPFECTMRLARQIWGIRPTKLPNVCAHLGLSLKHHHAESDAEACAGIVLAAHREFAIINERLNTS